MTYKCFDMVNLLVWGRKVKGEVRAVTHTSPAIYLVKVGDKLHEVTADKIQPLAANEA